MSYLTYVNKLGQWCAPLRNIKSWYPISMYGSNIAKWLSFTQTGQLSI